MRECEREIRRGSTSTTCARSSGIERVDSATQRNTASARNGGTVVLRPGPARDIERAVGIHTRLGDDGLAMDGRQLGILAQNLHEVGRHILAPRRCRETLRPSSAAATG